MVKRYFKLFVEAIRKDIKLHREKENLQLNRWKRLFGPNKRLLNSSNSFSLCNTANKIKIKLWFNRLFFNSCIFLSLFIDVKK